MDEMYVLIIGSFCYYHLSNTLSSVIEILLDNACAGTNNIS